MKKIIILCDEETKDKIMESLTDLEEEGELGPCTVTVHDEGEL